MVASLIHTSTVIYTAVAVTAVDATALGYALATTPEATGFAVTCVGVLAGVTLGLAAAYLQHHHHGHRKGVRN